MRALKVVEQIQDPEMVESPLWNSRLQMALLAPNGVKKLRELILELAIRGKLVPQNPRDEPASELLTRIKVQKSHFKKIEKRQAEYIHSDISSIADQPIGWARVNLGEVTEIIRGITFPGNEKSRIPEQGRIACLRTTNVQDHITWDDMLYIRQEFVSRDDQYLRKNDIVMSMANSRELVGKVALVNQELDQKYTFGGFLGVVRPYFINSSFLMIILRTPEIRSSLIDSASQTTNIANISLAKLRPLTISIAPLAEQERIVAKVDELMALCDKIEAQKEDAALAHEMLIRTLLDMLIQSRTAEEFQDNWRRIAGSSGSLFSSFATLFSTESSIDALKQAIRQIAVMGKLVPQGFEDEHAQELLKHIRKEKEEFIRTGKIKKEKPLKEITDTERPYVLPKTWCWARIGNCCLFTEYGLSEKTFDIKDGIPVLKMGDIQQGRVLLGGQKKVSKNVEGLLDLFLKKNDLLYNRTNSAELVGKTGIYLGPDDEYTFASYLIRIRCSERLSNPHYLNLAMNVPLFRETQIVPYIIQQCGQANVNGTILKNMLVPIPPLTEQRRIVAKVDELMALCDNLKERLVKHNDLHEHLATALVKQALAA